MNLPFALESDLCAVLERHIDGLFEVSNPICVRTLRERAVGRVIPDFLHIATDWELSGKRRQGLSSIDASLVAALLPGKPLRLASIARQLYTRAESLEPRLRRLEKRGVLDRVGSDVFSLRAGLSWWSVRIVAVEAKLRRWREALHQAVSYLPFANQAYVALPSALVEGNDALMTTAVVAGVGVIAVDEDDARLVLHAPHRAARSGDWVWLVSRIVGFRSTTRDGANTPPQTAAEKPGTSRTGDWSLCVG